MFQPAAHLHVYYDGRCPYCRREIAWYQRWAPDAHIVWRDLWRPEVLATETFTRAQALRWLHVRDGHGALHIGFDAHLLMWGALPGFAVIANTLAPHPRLRAGLERIYRWLVRWRPGYRAHRRAKRGRCGACDA